MTAPDYAAKELALWESALALQHQAEHELEQARSRGSRAQVSELLSKVDALRTRADLLLAHAVQVKRAFEDGWFNSDELTSTRLDLPDDLSGR